MEETHGEVLIRRQTASRRLVRCHIDGEHTEVVQNAGPEPALLTQLGHLGTQLGTGTSGQESPLQRAQGCSPAASALFFPHTERKVEDAFFLRPSPNRYSPYKYECYHGTPDKWNFPPYLCIRGASPKIKTSRERPPISSRDLKTRSEGDPRSHPHVAVGSDRQGVNPQKPLQSQCPPGSSEDSVFMPKPLAATPRSPRAGRVQTPPGPEGDRPGMTHTGQAARLRGHQVPNPRTSDRWWLHSGGKT